MRFCKDGDSWDGHWRKWFAWRPVKVCECTVWLETVERRKALTVGHGRVWRYRFVEGEEDG